MANAQISFGVDLVPYLNPPGGSNSGDNILNLGDSDNYWNIYANKINGTNMTDYVTKTGNQALTNKTYNGFSLAGACAKAVDSSISDTTSVNLPTSAAVANYVNDMRIEIWDLT